MQISQNLKLKQSQSLVMTPQLQQAIKLLQLNNLELTNLVNKELEENPFLENENIELDNDENLHEDKTTAIDDSFESGESISDEPKIEDYENRWDIDTSGDYAIKRNSSIESSDAGSVIEQTLQNKVSLKSILQSQAELEFEDQTDKLISSILIDYIDENGWITENLENISDFSGYSIEQIESLLLKMQSFDPNGVFARNFKECLKIQLNNDGLLQTENEIIIDNIELLGSGNIRSLQKLTNLKEQDLKEQLKLIKSLDPKPGKKYSDENQNIFHPDVIVTKNNENWSVELNESTLPKITVNEGYVKEIEALQCGESDKRFINESLTSARWLLKAIQQRNITTLKISSEIVNQQKKFFEKGKKYLRPMVLKDVAKKIGMHESTVSRVTSDKLMLTPRGVLEMKLFFSASINSTRQGETHSAESVRESLRKLISNEPFNNPLSDEMLVEKLQAEGIELARRTVAKYRELLNIPASSVRRKIMKIQNINL